MANAEPAQTLQRPQHRWFAAVYDRMSKMSEKQIGPVRAQVAGGAHGRVLEVGCGTGANLEHYDWQKVESLQATEPDPYMLKRVQPKLAALSAEARTKVTLTEAPAEALPFEDASFDTVVSTLVLCTVSDPGRALNEMHRVLHPTGELRLFEHVRGSGFRRNVQSVIQPVYGWTSGGCQLSRETEDSVRAAGFDLTVSDRTSLGPLWPAFVGIAKKT
jgi:ubiquinone/menaquinone biosynthesis C-methylase UbiE